MKTGKSLVELAQAIQDQQAQKRDFLIDTRKMAMSDTGTLTLEVPCETLETKPTSYAHGQIGERVGIPSPYYKRMLAEAPQLLAQNVNHWFNNKPETRLVRTLNGVSRAVLSDRYRRIDNFDLLNAIMPDILSAGDLQVISCDVTDLRLYLKVLSPSITRDIAVGDPVQSGFVISNSEIGAGAVKIEPLIYRLVCTNGMIANDFAQRKNHSGRKTGSENEAYELYSDETLRADDHAFYLKVRDTIRATLEETKFEAIVAQMRETKSIQLLQPVETVELTAKKFGLSDGERSNVLTHLIQSGDLSGYGLLNAVTRTAQDSNDYDRATEIERIGSKFLSLPQTSWRELIPA